MESQGMELLGLILDTKAQVFSIYRFTDDLGILNNNEFENNYGVYPTKLKFKKENETPWKALFLNRSTKGLHWAFAAICGKRDTLYFCIVCTFSITNTTLYIMFQSILKFYVLQQ